MATDQKYPCPACGTIMKPSHVSFSRYVNVYICSDCGVREAFEGYFWIERIGETGEKLPSQIGFKPYG